MYVCMYYIICIPRLTALDKTQGLDSRGLSYKNTKHKMNTCKNAMVGNNQQERKGHQYQNKLYRKINYCTKSSPGSSKRG